MYFPPLEPDEEFPPPPEINPFDNPDADPIQFPPDPVKDDPRDPGNIPEPEDIPPPV
jgi:hypothetical protein